MNDKDESYLHLPDSCSGVWPPMEFEGLWVEHWPNGQLKFRGHYKKGAKKVGQHISFFQNGVLQELSVWEDGYATGTVIWFREDGTKDTERDFGVNGGKTRSWAEREYGWDNNIYEITVWRNGEKVYEWLRPDMRKWVEESGLKRRIDKIVKSFYPGVD